MRHSLTAVLLSLLLTVGTGHAIVFYSTGSGTFNTAAPTGPLADSGWQYEGKFGGVTGTPIAPNFFITAEHIGGEGETFVYSGSTYTTVAHFDDPNSDLRIWQVSGTFSTYAPLYTKSDEVGKSLVMFGRGGPRGAEVVLSGTSKGWEWTAADETLRWGENEVAGIYNGGALYGLSLLGMTFSSDGGVNEGTYSEGDSGGGVFILDGGVWKLAGVNSYADGPYGPNATPYDQSFNASLYNQDGYYADLLTGWQPATGPGMIYASRISSSQEWIASVVPEPSTYALFALGGFVFLSRLRRRRTA